MRSWVPARSLARLVRRAFLGQEEDSRRLWLLLLVVVLAAVVFYSHRRSDPASLGNALPAPHVPGREGLDPAGAGKKIRHLEKEIFSPEAHKR